MANTSPVVDSLPVLKDLIDREKNEDIRIFQAAAISCSLKGKEAVDMEAMKMPVHVASPMTESLSWTLISVTVPWNMPQN